MATGIQSDSNSGAASAAGSHTTSASVVSELESEGIKLCTMKLTAPGLFFELTTTQACMARIMDVALPELCKATDEYHRVMKAQNKPQ